jgi:hypothetical protein
LESAEASGIAGVLNALTTITYVGDDAKKRQFRSILSFDTTGLPDNSVIVSATLKLKKQAGWGRPIQHAWLADHRHQKLEFWSIAAAAVG